MQRLGLAHLPNLSARKRAIPVLPQIIFPSTSRIGRCPRGVSEGRNRTANAGSIQESLHERKLTWLQLGPIHRFADDAHILVLDLSLCEHKADDFSTTTNWEISKFVGRHSSVTR